MKRRLLRVYLYDNKADTGAFMAKMGHKIISYHPKHKNAESEVEVYPQNGSDDPGILMIEGGDGDEFVEYLQTFVEVSGVQDMVVHSLTAAGDKLLEKVRLTLPKSGPDLTIAYVEALA